MAYSDIKDPSAYFQIATWTGNGGSNRAIVNDGNSNLQPDWVWYKSRSHATSNILYDSSRGADYYLKSNTSAGEGTDANMFESFDSDGFSLNADSDGNASSRTYVAWQWKANGGTTSSNTDGNITATVQANPTAGFSIVTYTGNGVQTGKTVGHGLGAVPKMIISKDRDGTSNVATWRVYHKAIGNTKYLTLNAGDAAGTYDDWDNTTPTSSVYSVGGAGGYTPTNTNNIDYVAYVFADVQGYSKFGSYTGNGESLNGPFVYTGFKPAWVMIKNTETASRNWYIYDIKRRTFNSNGTIVSANATNAEATDQAIDVLSNGFKVKPGALGSFGTSNINHSGQKMIYMAFAENPFVADGVPTTAR